MKIVGSLNIYQRERINFIWVSFYVSPSFSSNGLYRKSLKPITSKTEGKKKALEIWRSFDFDKYDIKRLQTTFHDTALKSLEQRIHHYKLKNRKREIERGMKIKNLRLLNFYHQRSQSFTEWVMRYIRLPLIT